VVWTKNKQREKIEVKLETGYYASKFRYESKTIKFPDAFSIKVLDINSLFAGKLHAVLAREKKVKIEKEYKEGEEIEYKKVDDNKGRDWYDFLMII